MGKGSRTERELFKELWGRGFAVMRSPTSGGARSEPQPDILASDGYHIYGIEGKSTSKDAVYIPKKELAELIAFCDRFGCTPLVGLRFDRNEWRFLKPNEGKETEKSSKFAKSEVMKNGRTLDDL